MKKFLSIVICVIITLSYCIIPASAYEKTPVSAKNNDREYNVYSKYVDEVLVPIYGCANFDNIDKVLSTGNIGSSEGWAKRKGIVSYDLVDLNNDGIDEMLLYVFDNESKNNILYCYCYTIKDINDDNTDPTCLGRAEVYNEKLGCTNYCGGGILSIGDTLYFYYESFYQDSYFANVMYAEYSFYGIDEYNEFDKLYSIKQSFPGSDGFDYRLIEYSRVKEYKSSQTTDSSTRAVSKSVQETKKETVFWTFYNNYTIASGINYAFDQLGFIKSEYTMGSHISTFIYTANEEQIYSNYDNISEPNIPENFPSYIDYLESSFTLINAPENHSYQKSGKYNFIDIAFYQNLYGVSDNGNSSNNYTYGDIDNDGKITSADSLMILRQSVNLENFTSVQLALADVDNDGLVTSADALEVLRYSVSLPTNYKVGTAF